MTCLYSCECTKLHYTLQIPCTQKEIIITHNWSSDLDLVGPSAVYSCRGDPRVRESDGWDEDRSGKVCDDLQDFREGGKVLSRVGSEGSPSKGSEGF